MDVICFYYLLALMQQKEDIHELHRLYVKQHIRWTANASLACVCLH